MKCMAENKMGENHAMSCHRVVSTRHLSFNV